MTWSPRQQPAAPDPAPAGHKTCPNCAEHVRAEARACRYCNHRFVRDPRNEWKYALAACIIGILILAYASGRLDAPLSTLGLNKSTCAENLFGNKMCGADLVDFCRDNYNPSVNADTCDTVLADEGIDPVAIADEQRADRRAFDDCIDTAVRGDGNVDDCQAP